MPNRSSSYMTAHHIVGMFHVKHRKEKDRLSTVLVLLVAYVGFSDPITSALRRTACNKTGHENSYYD